MNAGGAGVGVTHACDLDGAKDGLQQTSVPATVRVHDGSCALDDPQGEADIAVAALLNVGLEQQALHLTPPVLLRGLDLVQRELQSGRSG